MTPPYFLPKFYTAEIKVSILINNYLENVKILTVLRILLSDYLPKGKLTKNVVPLPS